MKNKKSILQRLSPELKYAIILLLITRIVLTPLMVEYRSIGLETSRFPSLAFVNYQPVWLGVWGMWDSAWYLDIARNWYSPEIKTDIWHYNQANYGFFPLYPVLIRLLGLIIGDFFIAGLIISNACLIIAAVLLYRLVRLEDDKETASRTIKYLFLFPSAFMLSAVLTESLSLTLILASFYLAKKGRWLQASTCGFLLALTKPYGLLIMLPLLYEYFKTNTLKLQAAYILLIPCGLLLFMSFTYALTGDFLAYVHIKESGWGHHLSNPFSVLYDSLIEEKASYILNGIFSILIITLIASQYKHIDNSYLLFGLLFIFAPLVNEGRGMLQCMTRYALLAFPLYIILAKAGKDRRWDTLLTVTLTILQLLLNLYWATGSGAV
jgi:hypothetical protein